MLPKSSKSNDQETSDKSKLRDIQWFALKMSRSRNKKKGCPRLKELQLICYLRAMCDPELDLGMGKKKKQKTPTNGIIVITDKAWL